MNHNERSLISSEGGEEEFVYVDFLVRARRESVIQVRHRVRGYGIGGGKIEMSFYDAVAEVLRCDCGVLEKRSGD